MSSDSDGGVRPRGWTVVDKHGNTEDSEDSSGSSSDFVDLGEQSVRYHHVSRSRSIVDVAPDNSASQFASSSLPANFKAHCGAIPNPEGHLHNPASSRADSTDRLNSSDIPDEAEIVPSDEVVRPRHYGNSPARADNISPRRAQVQQMLVEEWNLSGTANQPSDVENSASSSSSTLTGSRSPFPNDLTNSRDLCEGENVHNQQPANLSSVTLEKINDAETDVLDEQPSNTSDSISVDSIEVLSMPSNDEHDFQEDGNRMQGYGEMIGGEMEESKDASRLQTVPALFSMEAVKLDTDVIAECSNEPQTGSPSDESDTSEFERIDPEMVQSVDEIENQTNEVAEEGKMDVAGARPTEILEEDIVSNAAALGPTDQPQNLMDAQSLDPEEMDSPFLQQLNPSPSIIPNMSGPSSQHAANIHSWSGQPMSRIQPFPFDQLSGYHSRASSNESARLPHQPPNRLRLPRQHSNSSSEEVFELVQRPQGQDDDAVSVISSSSSDLSDFVNVRQRRGPPLLPPVSRRHSDFDDMLDSVSNFTDVSEDCLPANMMIQRQKSGVRQYRHHRDDGLNTRLDWLVAMVLLAGLALGIGHFIGSTQEMAHQHSINTGQVQRLHELQDDLVTCLDRSSGIDSRITTEKSSPALQAVKLLEGLNSKMQEGLDASRFLEQQVGPDQDGKGTHSEDAVLNPTEKEEVSGDEALKDSQARGDEKVTGKDVTVAPTGIPIGSSDIKAGESKDSSNKLEPESFYKPKEHDVLGPNEQDGVTEPLNDQILNTVGEPQSEVSDAFVVPDGTGEVVMEKVEDTKMKEHGESADESQEDASPDFGERGKPKGQQLGVEDEKASENLEKEHPNIEIGSANTVRDDKVSDSVGSVDEVDPSEVSSTDQEVSNVEVLQRKIELMEEKMNRVMETAQHWQDMLDESMKAKNTDEDKSQTQHCDSPSKSDEDISGSNDKQDDEDPLAGIAATLQSLWPGLLKTDQGKVFLHYLNLTQEQSVLWSEAVYRELDSLKALSDSDEVQAIVNNTKLFASHLGKEVESVTGYLRNQSARLVKENNITVEGIGEKANSAWTKLTNVTSGILEFNKWMLSSVGEQLTETLHSVENISAEMIAKQNLSMSSASNMAEQIWGTVKNYSSLVTETILNKTSESSKNSKSAFDDDSERKFKDMHSDSDSVENPSSSFGEKLKGAWDSVRNYSTNLTSKQNLSISGLREQVKTAWGKVKNTSAQVMDDISESNIAEKLKDGAKKFGEKVGTTLNSVKEKVKGFHKRKWGHDKKKHHYDHSDRHHKSQKWRKKKHHKKNHEGFEKHDKHKETDEFQTGKDDEEVKSQKRFNGHHKNERRQTPKREHVEQHSVPSRGHRHYSEPDTNKSHKDETRTGQHPEQDKGYLYSAPPRLQPTQSVESAHEEWQKQDAMHSKLDQPPKQEQQNSLPSRQQVKQHMKTTDARNQDQPRLGDGQDVSKDEKMTSGESFKERGKGCPQHLASVGSKENGEKNDVSNWEDLFDCFDMHCKGDEECMHSQRRDAARLYSELLDYQEWLKQRNLRKDVRELKEFLEELGEFLSETDSDDRDLDELKDEFGEMVQDMEERALKRLRKQDKSQSLGTKPLDKDHYAEKQDDPAAVNNPEEVENSTVIIDLKTLPQDSNQAHFSSETQHSGDSARRKYAGRGYHSTDDNNDWYLQRAKDRAAQRGSHHWTGDEKHPNMPNWYLHWIQGRINGRTGVTVWDMYEWIKERYVLREELRRHEMEDHTNWFLRRP